jgi:hypothetical protein
MGQLLGTPQPAPHADIETSHDRTLAVPRPAGRYDTDITRVLGVRGTGVAAAAPVRSLRYGLGAGSGSRSTALAEIGGVAVRLPVLWVGDSD